jgi:hypothetical protein
MKYVLVLIFTFYTFYSEAQRNALSGIVVDESTHSPLAGASVTLYQSNQILGAISNGEGKFSIGQMTNLDSVRFSVIGYRSRVYVKSELNKPFITIDLEQSSPMLPEVVVHAIGPTEIVLRAAQKIPSFIPSVNFESRAFYREIIQDSARYYSVAEALFNFQYSVQKKSFKLKLEKGRSKEEVAYTRLFEDYHPGGGPEDAAAQSLVIRRPEFLDETKLKKYNYKRDSTIRLDDEIIYVIGFDQKPGIHEALEKGRIYIDAGDFSVLKFEAMSSPLGTPYIKSLRGTDKIFAELLHIDLNVRGWARSAIYTKLRGKLFLSYAKMDYRIDYKQSRKSLDLALHIHTDLLITDFQHPLTKDIPREEEWKRKNLVANLPSDFDTAFWGTNNILDPTAEVNHIIASISKKNNEPDTATVPGDWQFLNKAFFVAYNNDNRLTIVPIAKCSWKDGETGGMMYKNKNGNFSVETKIEITKRSDQSRLPDNGFQQCGIIVRSATAGQENNLIVSMGTGGNEIPKYFLERTNNKTTKTTVLKTKTMTGWFRIEKRDKRIVVYQKPDKNNPWEKMGDYEMDWLAGDLQVGFSVMAKFAGDGPKQRPDMKALISEFLISDNE